MKNIKLKYPFVIFNQSNESISLQEKIINELDMSWSFSSGRSPRALQPDNITYIYSNWNFDGNLLLETETYGNNPNDKGWDRSWKDKKGKEVSWSKYIWDGVSLILID